MSQTKKEQTSIKYSISYILLIPVASKQDMLKMIGS